MDPNKIAFAGGREAVEEGVAVTGDDAVAGLVPNARGCRARNVSGPLAQGRIRHALEDDEVEPDARNLDSSPRPSRRNRRPGRARPRDCGGLCPDACTEVKGRSHQENRPSQNEGIAGQERTPHL